MDKREIENMIKKYTDELMKIRGESVYGREEALSLREETRERESFIEADYTEADTEPHRQEKSEEADTEYQQEPSEESAEPVREEAEDYCIFSARVSSGRGAYPVENAKVLIFRGTELFALLVTDREGLSEKISLPAEGGENTLTPEAADKLIMYTAGIYAEGFYEKKGLSINAVGGSETVLEAELIPLSEGVSP